ncbi:MAG TPA: LLM class F420-dependent oxidoreductase [Acidimicrobiales bacterium]
MRFGITFGRLNPRVWLDAVVAADERGFESAWLPEHLVFPVTMTGQLIPGEEHPPVPPSTPVYDAAAYLSFVAARTERIRLGTFVYLLAIRHPFVAARAFATLDVVSGGRAIAGVGAGWLRSEWEAVGLDPSSRGARLDESIDVCRRLWTDEVIEHHGVHFSFDPVMFEPKPVHGPVPIHVGGESPRALRRAARSGDGWLGMAHTFESASERVTTLHRLLDDAGRSRDDLEITVTGPLQSAADVDRWHDVGVDRIIVNPWRRSSEAVEAIHRFADEFIER